MIDKIIITLYTIYLFFVPESLSLGFFSYSKILLIMTFLILLYNCIFNQKRIVSSLKKNKKIYFLLLCLAFITLFSNLVNLISGSQFLLTNFYEMLRILLYIGIFCVYSLYFDKYNNFVTKISLFFVFINCLLGITQFYNFFGMNEIYVKFFAPTQYGTLVGGYAYPRVIGFTSNPNVYGFLLSIFSIFILNLLVSHKKNIYLYIMFFIVKINLYMTMSRSSFICAFIGEILFMLVYYFKNKEIKKMLLSVFSIILLELSLMFLLPNSLTWRIKQLVNIDTLTSWQKRQEHNKEFIDGLLNNGISSNEYHSEKDNSIDNIASDNSVESSKIDNISSSDSNIIISKMDKTNYSDKNVESSKIDRTVSSNNSVEKEEEIIFQITNSNFEVVSEQSQSLAINKQLKLLIGTGSDKLASSSYYDNEWILLFHRYGILGVVCIVFVFVSFILSSSKGCNKKRALASALIVISMVYMYPAAIIHSYKLFPILLLILAYCCSSNKKTENNKNVLILATYFPPYGGVGVMRVTKFAKYLKLKGWNPIIVTSSTAYCKNYDQSLLKDISDLKIYRLDINNKCNNIGKSFYRYLNKDIGKIIKKENPMCAFITGGPFYLFKIGLLLYNRYSLPYILDFRDPWTMQVKHEKNIKAKLIELRDTVNEFFSILYCSFTITVNQTLANQYEQKYPFFKKKIYVIGNGYDNDDFDNVKAKEFNEFTILYSGKFEVSAGFRDPTAFFRALRNVNNTNNKVNFVHVGNIEQKVVEIAKREKIYKYCKFLGYQSYCETISYCKGADLLLIISGTEKSEQTGKVYDYIGCNNRILAITDKRNELYKICVNLSNCLIADPNDEKMIEKMIYEAMKEKNNYISKNNVLYDREYLTDSLIEILTRLE